MAISRTSTEIGTPSFENDSKDSDEYYGFSEDQVRETFQQLIEDLRAIAEAQESLSMIPSIDSEPFIDTPASASDKPASTSNKPASASRSK
ncbi:hypothetical protein QYM36_005283 [Artemia franciscana]|uniref:Uncharacterized protein n=1 Tax=Artemia franciscana TaxID=6661 RepID=A0AA88I414_ARTSF|nr:hypothetical protein QYM36_005283 [Artemia franciscana]